jgi:hypothetical protein
MEYYKDRIYPNSVPEFRMFQKSDGIMEMQVRYINKVMNYIGKWQTVQMAKENDTNSHPQA